MPNERTFYAHLPYERGTKRVPKDNLKYLLVRSTKKRIAQRSMIPDDLMNNKLGRVESKIYIQKHAYFSNIIIRQPFISVL